jgi:hypothetical protein
MATKIIWKHSSGAWISDIPGIGRYRIKRRVSGAREHILLLDNKRTKYYGTVDELKKTLSASSMRRKYRVDDAGRGEAGQRRKRSTSWRPWAARLMALAEGRPEANVVPLKNQMGWGVGRP